MLTTWNLKKIANCDYYSSHINLRYNTFICGFGIPAGSYRNRKFYFRLW